MSGTLRRRASCRVMTMSGLQQRWGDWYDENRWLVWLFLAALAIRLHWNLSVHPLGEYQYSDMRGYTSRADRLLANPFESRAYDAFFPFFTTWMIAAVKYVFGAKNFVALGCVYALLGSFVAAFTYAITRRITPEHYTWVAPSVGLFSVVYYPLISIGGYTLSEIPFAFCVAAATLSLLRLADHGRAVDAWTLGITLGIGLAIRSQMLMAIAVIAVYWLFARKLYPNITARRIVQVAIPVVLCLAGCSARLYAHTGRFGLVSENAGVNLVFGRCHAKGIHAKSASGSGSVRFAPPPLIQLESHSAKFPNSPVHMRPVLGEKSAPMPDVPGFAVDGRACKHGCKLRGAEVEYTGYIGDQKIQRRIVRHCMERSGLLRQAYYSFVHIVQLWEINLMWPDSANPRPRPKSKYTGWRANQQRWRVINDIFIVFPALGGLWFLRRYRSWPGQALVAAHFASLILVAIIFWGGIRFRVPYDPIIIVLAAQSHMLFWPWLRARFRRK